ncbi:MAG: LysM peptidoglycan-binding domain-containing protein [Acidobacteria bacterium]|nr:LysM peptidoglycan-binding domain-containing protein [Acidobacteriota bacterium]
MRPKLILRGLVGLALAGALVAAQDAPPGLQTGPAEVAPHWTKNPGFPTSIPEGSAYHIVERGDTLWDLAARFLDNPYLWPQLWDTNKYIEDAHWIYPGDPVVLPEVAVITEGAGEELAVGPPAGIAEEFGLEGAEGEMGPAGGPGTSLRPVTEETALQCADYIVDKHEDDSLYIIGSEQGQDHYAFAERDIVYLSKGSNAGVRAGDLYSLQHVAYAVNHPATGRKLGTKIETTGWVKVILVQEDTATAVIEESCMDIHAADYLKPFERVNVPMVVRRTPADRLTPPTGKVDAYIIAIQNDATVAGQGHFVSIDAGSEDGISPGSVFSIYRVMYPSVPTPRNVVGQVTVVATRDTTSTAKVTYSREEIMVGDQIELR